MNSRERTIAALKYKSPDRIPVDIWLHGATKLKYAAAIEAVLARNIQDVIKIGGPGDIYWYPEYMKAGTYIDYWGSEWLNMRDGMIGEVKKAALADKTLVAGYTPPLAFLEKEWLEGDAKVDEEIFRLREENKFIVGGVIQIFEQMQFLRGVESLYMDIAYKEKTLFQVRDIVTEYMEVCLEHWLGKDVDAIFFSDDWGAQVNTLISPEAFRKIFKPIYKRLIDKVKKAGKYIFFHSDGFVYPFYKDWIELGVDAINSQLWCMNMKKISKNYKGKITFWGELDRQKVLAFGSVQEIFDSAKKMKELFNNSGGLIGQCVVGVDVSLEKIEAALQCWNKK